MTVKERIQEYLNYKGISVYQFEMSINKTKSYFRNTTNITSDVCALICEKYPDINGNWLLRGEGDMVLENVEFTASSDEPKGVDTGLRKRLVEFINYLDISYPVFEAKANLARGTISHIKYGMSSSNLFKLATAFPQLDIYWLIGVAGHNMIRKDFDENSDLKERLDKIIDMLGRKDIS